MTIRLSSRPPLVALLLLVAGSAAHCAPRTAHASAASFAARGPRITTGSEPKQMLVYVGTYTQKSSNGIYPFRLDLASGKLTPAVLAGESVSPSFVAIHPSHRFL